MNTKYKILVKVVFGETIFRYELIGEVVMHDLCYKVITKDTTCFFPIVHTILELTDLTS